MLFIFEEENTIIQNLYIFNNKEEKLLSFLENQQKYLEFHHPELIMIDLNSLEIQEKKLSKIIRNKIKLVDKKLLKVMLIEDNQADADWIKEILIEERLEGLELKHVKGIDEGLDILSQDYFDVLLLDLFLPDNQRIDNIAFIKEQAPELPIIVLTIFNDRNMAIESVRKGAQDYLIKGRFEKELLIRSIYYAIERQRTEETLRQHRERERLMNNIINKVGQSLDLTEILATTVDEVRQFLKTEHVLIYRYESVSPGQIIAESKANHNSDFSKSKLTTKDSSLELYLALSDYTHLGIAKDIWQLKPSSSDIYQSTINSLKSILTLPIWRAPQATEQENKEQLWGMLVAHNGDQSRLWQEWEIDFLQQLTAQVTIAIQKSELYYQIQKANQKLERLAILDGLTGVANRRYFDLVLSQEWNRLAREKKPLSLIFCDIDYFKIYNDTYGHPEGDSCLKKVAHILQQVTKRSAYLVTRYGGEEFAIILPSTDEEGALFVAEKIREKLSQLKIPHSGSTVSPYVTLSIGIATRVPIPNQNASNLLNIADLNLYQAKEQGRDCIVQSQ